MVESPSTLAISVPYTAQTRRELEIVLHDAERQFEVLAKGSVILEAGSGVHTFNLKVRANAREGDGHVWAVRLLPIDWVTSEDAIDQVYADASLKPNSAAPPVQDSIANFEAPTSVSGGSASCERVAANSAATSARRATWACTAS